MKHTTVVLFCSLSAYAQVCSSTAAGNWNNAAIWSCGQVPTFANTCSVGHAVEVTDTRQCGTSPADQTTMALTVNTPGSLTVRDGGNLTVRGNIRQNAAPITVEGSGVLEVDGSVSGTSYRWQMGTASNQSNTAYLAISGASLSSRAGIRSNAGGPNAFLERGSGTTGNGAVRCSNGFIQRFGSSSVPAILYSPTHSLFDMTWNRCLVTDSGLIDMTGVPHAGAVLDIQNSTLRGCLDTAGCIEVRGTAFTTGRCVLRGLVVEDAPLLTSSWTGCSLEEIFARNRITGAAGSPSLWRNIVHRNSQSSAGGHPLGTGTTYEDTYWLCREGNTNCHFVGTPTSGVGLCVRCIAESLNDKNNGDLFNGGSGISLTVRDSISLPSHEANDGASGCFSSMLGAPGFTFYGEKNTVAVGEDEDCDGGVRQGESYAGHAGIIGYWRSNAYFRVQTVLGAGLPAKAHGAGGSANWFLGAVSAADINYNGGDPANFRPGAAGNGYDIRMASGTPGVNDLNEDGKFVDPRRSIGRWYAYLTDTPYVKGEGPTGSARLAMDALAKRNESDWDPRFNIPSLLNWVREGFAPRNTNYATRGHDGGRIGAVAPRNMGGPVGGI
jgi:hypothetical protein